MRYLIELLDAVISQPVETVIGSVVVSLMLASPMALVHTLGRRSGKDLSTLLVSIAMTTNFVGMAVAVGHIKYLERSSDRISPTQSMMGPDNRPFPSPGKPRLSDFVAENVTPALISAWDADRDKRLSTEEAIAAVTEFIKSSGSDKGRSSSEDEITWALAEAIDPYIRRRSLPEPAPGPENSQSRSRAPGG
jgi:hypothetical protein